MFCCCTRFMALVETCSAVWLLLLPLQCCWHEKQRSNGSRENFHLASIYVALHFFNSSSPSSMKDLTVYISKVWDNWHECCMYQELYLILLNQDTPLTTGINPHYLGQLWPSIWVICQLACSHHLNPHKHATYQEQQYSPLLDPYSPLRITAKVILHIFMYQSCAVPLTSFPMSSTAWQMAFIHLDYELAHVIAFT